jgi:hypothetical protein
MVNKGKEGTPDITYEAIDLLITRHLIIIPLLVRIFSLGESMKYNYHHLSKKFYDERFKENENNFREKYYSKKFHNVKLCVIILVFIFTLFALLYILRFTRCSLFAFVFSFYKQDAGQISNCGGDSVIYLLTGDLMVNIYSMLENIIFVYLLYRVFKFPIRNDKFYLRLEFISLFIVWFIFHHISLGVFYIADKEVCLEMLYIINSARNGLMALIYFTVSLIRRNISFEELQNMMTQFDTFMHSHVCFSFFLEYVKNNHEEDYKLLSFWIEYNIFKKEADCMVAKDPRPSYHSSERKNSAKYSYRSQDLGKSKESEPLTMTTEQKRLYIQYEDDLRDIREMAESIYNDYFTHNRTQSLSPSSNSYMTIPFPVDISEKMEELAKISFNVEELNKVFDEAFNWVSNKLFNLFVIFWKKEEEYKKLQRIVFFIDFYEIKRLAISN